MKLTRYTLVLRAGVWLDYWTAQLWDKLVAKFPGLQLVQGVNSGAAASGGTHLGLGVLDFYLGKWAPKWRDVLRYAFEIGFFGWFRPELWQRGKRVWKTHIHLGVRGHAKMVASLKKQQTSWTKRRNGLQGDGPDAFTWRPANFKKKAPFVDPAKPVRKVHPWINARFLNLAGNNEVLKHTFSDRAPDMASDLTHGSPHVIGVCELQSGEQEKRFTKEMSVLGYTKAAYSHMLGVYVSRNVTVRGASFARYKKQRGGTVEGVLRVKITVDGSKAQVGVTHLDFHKSFEAGRKTTAKEAVSALQRYGLVTLALQWKKRSILMGDFNSRKSDGWLEPLGFKSTNAGQTIDEIYTGADRPVRDSGEFKSNTDHKGVWAKLGRY